jgi:hypothetical protein
MLGGEEEEPLFSSSCRSIQEEELHHDRFLFLILLYSSVADPDPASGDFLTPGSGIRDEQPGSYFLQFRNHFFGLKYIKYLNSLMRIRDPGWKKVGSGINIPDPQHCFIPVLWFGICRNPH